MYQNQKKYYILDMLKFIMSLFIVLLHSMNIISGESAIESFYYEYPTYYILAAIISRLGVPSFFIISGFLFFNRINNLEKKEQIKYYLNYCKRNLLFWFISSICYIPFMLIIEKNIELSFSYLLNKLVFIGIAFHLWYLLGVVIAVSLVFLLHCLKIKNIFILIFSFLLYLIGYLGELDFILIKYFFFFDFIVYLSEFFITFRNGLFLGTIFVFIGKYLSELKNFKIVNKRKIIYILLFFIFLFLMIFNILNSSNKTNDFNFFLIPLSFILLRVLLSLNISCKHEKIYNNLRKISFYIYLVHPYIQLFLFVIPLDISYNSGVLFIGIFNILISLIISLLFLFYKNLIKKCRKE